MVRCIVRRLTITTLFIQKGCQEQARNIQGRYWHAVEALAAVLLEKRRILGGEADLSSYGKAIGETSTDCRMTVWNING